jgi:hypothetical protein
MTVKHDLRGISKERLPRAHETGSIQMFSYNGAKKKIIHVGCTFHAGRGVPMSQVVKDNGIKVYVPNKDTYEDTLEAAEKVFKDAGYEIISDPSE